MKTQLDTSKLRKVTVREALTLIINKCRMAEEFKDYQAMQQCRMFVYHYFPMRHSGLIFMVRNGNISTNL